MVSVLFVWGYMIFVCYVIGFSVLKAAFGGQGYTIRKESSFLYAGIVATTVYAQLFSLFYKVGLAANLILLVLCAVCILCQGRELLEHFHTLRLTVTPLKAGSVILLLLLFAYGTSGGIIHYDTGLYHAQSIRWIEEYGIVPGLGNLHSRLAYNSSSFCLSALYSFSFLGGQSFHCCAGFLAFLLALACGEGFTLERLRRPGLSDFVRVMAVYYLLIIFDEMVSPASDYFMVLSVFYILIRWLELTEREEHSYVPYALLCLMGVWVVTVKLSGAMLLLLAVKPLLLLAREKKLKKMAGFAGLGILTAVPYLIRNVILSGWLLYPSTIIDLFDFDFKIPEEVARYDAREIQVWGRGLFDVTRFEDSFVSWFPRWVMALDTVNKVFLLLALASLILFLGLCVYAVKKRQREMTDYLLITGTMAICFLFWLTSAPLIRYGCVYLWTFPVLVWGFFYRKISPGIDRYRLYLAVLLLVGCYKAYAFAGEVWRAATGEFLVFQKDYENFETKAYELHGYTFYYPVSGDRTGYKDFPASPQRAEDIFRGDTIEDGFIDVIHSIQNP